MARASIRPLAGTEYIFSSFKDNTKHSWCCRLHLQIQMCTHPSKYLRTEKINQMFILWVCFHRWPTAEKDSLIANFEAAILQHDRFWHILYLLTSSQMRLNILACFHFNFKHIFERCRIIDYVVREVLSLFFNFWEDGFNSQSKNLVFLLFLTCYIYILCKH